MNTPIRLALCGAASVVAISHAGLSHAAEAAAQPPSQTAPAESATPTPQLAEVVVTAQKRSENIQNVPIAVSAIGAKAIRDRNIENLEDVQSQVPGLKFGHFAGGNNVTIRGVGTAFVSGAGQSSVAVYVNGVYVSQSAALGMGQVDLAGIEVLKGPQGTLYGRNSTGGVVSFTTNAPTKEFSYGATVGLGNYNASKEEGYVSGPLSDRVRLRLFVSNEDHDGYISNDVTGQKIDNLRSFGGRLSLDADITDRWKAEIRLSSFKDNYAGPSFDGFDPAFSLFPAPYNDFNDYRISSPVHFGSERNDATESIRNIFTITDHIRLVSITGFDDFLNNERYDGVANSLASFPAVIHRRADDFTQELNLIGESKNLNWIVGAFYFNQIKHQFNLSDESNLAGLTPERIVVGAVNSGVVEYGQVRSLEKSGSLFGDVSYSVLKNTKVFAGVRGTYDQVSQDLTTGIDVFGTATNSCSPSTDPEFVKDTSVTGRVGVQQTLTTSSMVYGQFSHGYKSPGFSETTCRNGFLAETINSVEFGYKSQWFGGKLTFNADAFHYGYDNLQLEVATAIGLPVVNAPQAHVWGFESNVVARPLADLRFDAGLVLLDASYDRFINEDANNGVAVGTSLAGVQLNNAPKAAGNFGVEFDQHLAEYGKLTWRAEVYATTSYHLREINEPYAVQNANGIVNLYSTYETPDGHYQVRLFAKNVGGVTVLAGELGFGGALGEFGSPRTFGGEASVRF